MNWIVGAQVIKTTLLNGPLQNMYMYMYIHTCIPTICLHNRVTLYAHGMNVLYARNLTLQLVPSPLKEDMQHRLV
jgi:hypothetical protein